MGPHWSRYFHGAVCTCGLDTVLADLVSALTTPEASKEEYCATCGHPRSNQPDLSGIDISAEGVIKRTRGRIVPCYHGGVQIEWHRDGVDLEVEFNADGSISSVIFGPSPQVGYHGTVPVSEPRLNIPVTPEELDYVQHAASLRSLSLVEYVRRAINLSLRKEGVDALLLAQSDD